MIFDDTAIDWLAGTTLWTAEYTTRDAPKWPTATWPKWSLWQYSDGKAGGAPRHVDGVSTCDCNEFNGTEAECRAWLKATVADTAPTPDGMTLEERVARLEAAVFPS